MHNLIAILSLATFFAVSFSAQLIADIVPPSGLAPGSQYQLVFVTADSTTATSSNIADYNAFVTSQAALNPSLPQGVTWTAIASTVSVMANSNAPSDPTFDTPVFNTRGQLVGTYIYDDVTLPIQFDQFGTLINSFVWTGSAASGTIPLIGNNAFGDYALGAPNGVGLTGVSGATGAAWLTTDYRFYSQPLSTLLPLYALSSPITVPAPEPSSLVLAVLGSIGLVAWGRRRRRTN